MQVLFPSNISMRHLYSSHRPTDCDLGSVKVAKALLQVRLLDASAPGVCAALNAAQFLGAFTQWLTMSAAQGSTGQSLVPFLL